MYILLVFDGRYLFVPQNEVQLVEIIAGVQIMSTDVSAVGWFFGHRLESPVYCLAYDLSLLLKVPVSRKYVVLIKAKPQPLGILCDDVQNIKLEQGHFENLPTVMNLSMSPISQLIIYQEKIACVCSGAALNKYLSKLHE